MDSVLTSRFSSESRVFVPVRPESRQNGRLEDLRYPRRTFKNAFSLIELLVVISIIGILAAIGLPALRGLGGSNAIDAGKRQLLDDLALARLQAMNGRTTVYVLFVPPGVTISNLYNHQFTSYALYTKRAVGDQPGRGNSRFLTEWKHLPENVFIAPYKFDPTLTNAFNEYDRSFLITMVSNVTRTVSRAIPFSYLAFDASGQLASKRGDEVIALTKGSIFYQPNGVADVVETPTSKTPTNFFRYANNLIRINWLTGRARIEKREPL